MNLDDIELLARIRKGDETAFESLFRTYYTPLCHFSYKIVREVTIAEEIVQDIFFHFWEKRHGFEMQHSLKAYLYQAVYNNSLKYLRHQKIVNAYVERTKIGQLNAVEFQENYAEIGELSRIITETLYSVPDRTREIFCLNRDEGLKYQEIADKLHISVKTVEAHISSLLKLFRENLKDYLFIVFLLLANFLG